MAPMLGAALAAALAASPAPASDAALIRQATREFVEAFNGRDVERVLRFYADPYVDLNLRRAVQTREQRRRYFERLLSTTRAIVEVEPVEIVVTGEYAFVRGNIRLRDGAASGSAAKTLRYMEVARRFADGWRAVWGIDAEVHPDDTPPAAQGQCYRQSGR
jgi:ketosteroid isomerase-like protein